LDLGHITPPRTASLQCAHTRHVKKMTSKIHERSVHLTEQCVVVVPWDLPPTSRHPDAHPANYILTEPPSLRGLETVSHAHFPSPDLRDSQPPPIPKVALSNARSLVYFLERNAFLIYSGVTRASCSTQSYNRQSCHQSKSRSKTELR
jgi:hypothetical protein